MAKNSGSKTTAETWEERYSTAAGNQAKMFKRFGNWYDSLYAIVGVTPSPWRSKMFVPVLARQTWALVSKFLNLKPGFEVRLQGSFDDEGVEEKATKAQKKLEYDYNNPYLDEPMRDKLFAPLLDAVVTGTGLAKVCWKVEKIDKYERLPTKDGSVDLSKEKKTTKTRAYNDLEPVNIFNVFVSPAATNLYSAPWLIIKELKSISDLKEINAVAGVDIYTKLDQLSGTSGFDDEENNLNKSRNRLMNQTDRIDSTVKMVKLFECYEGDYICTYAETQKADSETSWLKIREQKNPYWHGKYPLVKFHVKNKPFQFWGEGLFETTYRLQAGYNDAFNHFMDQWNLAENSMLIAKENTNVNDYVIEPGGVITYRGDQKPEQFKHAMPDGSMLQEILGLMDQAIEGVTISNYASGLPNSSTDKTKGTATGILKLQEAAGDLVAFMRTNFQQTITQVGRMWLSNNQQYMTEPVNITVNEKGKNMPMTVKPEDMQGDMDLVVDEASMEPLTKEQKRDNFMAFTQQFLALKQAADVQHQMLGTPPLAANFNEYVEDLAENFGIKNFSSALLSEEELQPLMQQAQQNMAGMAGQQGGQAPKQPSETLAYKDATPFTKAQIEQQAGLQPDPIHQLEEEALKAQLSQAASGQPDQQAAGPDPNQLTPEHLIKAAQFDHQAAMDQAKHQLAADQQDFAQGHQAAQFLHQAEQAKEQAKAQAQQKPGLVQRVKAKLPGGKK